MAGRVMELSIPFNGEGFEKTGKIVYTFDKDTIVFKQVCEVKNSDLIYTKITTIVDRVQFEKGVDKLKENNYVCFRDHNDEITISIDIKVRLNDGKREIVADMRMYHLGKNITGEVTVSLDKFELMCNEITRNQRIMDNELIKEVVN
ncbi:hypothetical protein BELINDA_281 [Bacillus phage Belinda]|uniref:hypothetical protein n=1 Tax=Bacillus phage Belinda TaxID=1852564 RepID=UPI0007F17660|nr:hypothetical protein BI039_gp097 [Bacillus phage Belinda]ANM46207.1 hypothetical protein BELINDA_281 [Bacillus phage Belinda]